MEHCCSCIQFNLIIFHYFILDFYKLYSGTNISSTLVISPADDVVLLGYGEISNLNSSHLYFKAFYSDNSSWSLPYRIAHLPGGAEGIIDENGNFTAYNDSIDESALAIGSANARFIFVWSYNQKILYRTWSAAGGASQIYSVSNMIFYFILLANKYFDIFRLCLQLCL